MQDQQFEDSIASVRELEDAVTLIFQHSFDADSKVCLLTLMKMLDNLLHKPGNQKVRTIRLQNDTFDSKVGCRKGGIEFLIACGFEREIGPPPLLAATEATGEELLVLKEDKESQKQLITARRLLQMRAVQDLGIKPDQLPVYRPPPAVTSANASATGSSDPAAFNPYAGHRFDAKSAAVGANLGPDANYVSKTESELQRLKQKQASLEGKLQKKLHPGWRAFAPGQEIQIASNSSTSSSKNSAGKTDSSLIADRLKRQQQERLQREQGGFTTKSMRDLEKMKKQKVYSHVTLTIQFPDGSKLQGQFLPKTKMEAVCASLRQDCLIHPEQDLDLYLTPPRRLLTGSLQEEGLVPAAKVFCSWKTVPAAGPFLRPELFSGTAVVFPSSQPIAAENSKPAAAKPVAEAPKPKKKKESREDAMLRRMMGR